MVPEEIAKKVVELRRKTGARGKIDWWVNAAEVHSFDPRGPFS